MKVIFESLNYVSTLKVAEWSAPILRNKSNAHLTKATKFSDKAFPKTDHLTDPWNNKHRISLNLLQSDSEHYGPVSKHLDKLGFKVKDYIAGTATDKHGRDIKIGKILHKAGSHDLLQKFSSDPARENKNKSNLRVVISRSPYHVARATADCDPWNSSCINMSHGVNKHFNKSHIEAGSHIAFLIHKDDVNIEKPISRILLHPFSGGRRTVLRPEGTVYGGGDSDFVHTVHSWANKHFPLSNHAYTRTPGTYSDDGVNIHASPKTMYKIIRTEQKLGNDAYDKSRQFLHNIAINPTSSTKDLHRIFKLHSNLYHPKSEPEADTISSLYNHKNADKKLKMHVLANYPGVRSGGTDNWSGPELTRIFKIGKKHIYRIHTKYPDVDTSERERYLMKFAPYRDIKNHASTMINDKFNIAPMVRGNKQITHKQMYDILKNHNLHPTLFVKPNLDRKVLKTVVRDTYKNRKYYGSLGDANAALSYQKLDAPDIKKMYRIVKIHSDPSDLYHADRFISTLNQPNLHMHPKLARQVNQDAAKFHNSYTAFTYNSRANQLYNAIDKTMLPGHLFKKTQLRRLRLGYV